MSARAHKKNKNPGFLPIILIIIVVFGVIVYYGIKFATPSVLKAYIAAGTGSCQTAPIFCMHPEQEVVVARIDKEFLEQLALFKFDDIEICMPKDFTVTHERSERVYYKKWKQRSSGSSAFLLNQPPDYFVHLFPQLRGSGVKNDYDFLDRTMSASLENIKNSTDAFFVIVKGIFIPDIGDQRTLKMIRFKMGDRRGFINYNLSPGLNYFDCNIITNQGAFLKVYIKDTKGRLDLEKVFTILSSFTYI